ncbi:hypothetical protein SmJEL517_g01028 [Synchytrium microbalum]|uniref:Eukaryotic translation initiation factor 3 subunit J n=1 Tax=Synchytrium microbalum TaxID=1806994 RepID=A0A507CBV3_9FUNG|nr:uncharacterized protein SmJEL517_g01028 [Synchytrium microbalum]TPX36971.1 hypothetical protein SmJEL517_g01028 [Synchytrium microbalum]
MGDWDDEDAEAPAIAPIAPIAKPSQWEGEDVEDEDESWDDDEEEKPKSPSSTTTSAPAPAKKKQTLAQKIAARKEEEDKKRQAAADSAKNTAEIQDDYETPEEKKARQQKQILDSDLENAKDLFGSTSSVVVEAPPSKLETMDPKSKEEFEEYRTELTKLISKFEKRAQYSSFVEFLARDLCVSMDPTEIKRIATTLTALASERQKAMKPVAPGKKKAAPRLAASKASRNDDLDLTAYDDSKA